MRRSLAIAVAIGIVAGCASSGSATPSSLAAAPEATTPGSTATSASVQPSVAPTAFPTEAFAALGDDPISDDMALKLQDALAALAPYGDGGIAATVMSDGGTWSGAAGKADDIHEMDVDSQFGIGSVTKSIVAAQVMLMVQAGDISLDAPASDYLPAGLRFDTNGATIRHLLSNRSGIPFVTDDVGQRVGEDLKRAWKLDEVLAAIDPARRPLDAFDYSDTNYILLGRIIEQVRQRSLVDVLRAGALRVDGTNRLIYQPAEAPSDPMAMQGGGSRDDLEQGGGYLGSLAGTSFDGAAGAMASDSISLARWWRAFCAGEIVSQVSLTEMSTFYDNSKSELPVDYGLGLFNPAEGYAEGVGHMGQAGDYNAWAACLTDDRLIVVVLTNDDYNSGIFEVGRPLIMAARSH
jgi:D-alanyl-D-alanine carboxypeptidase